MSCQQLGETATACVYVSLCLCVHLARRCLVCIYMRVYVYVDVDVDVYACVYVCVFAVVCVYNNCTRESDMSFVT